MYCKTILFLVIDATLESDNPLSFRKNLSERIRKLIMKIDVKTRNNKLQHDINTKSAKILALSLCKIDKYE